MNTKRDVERLPQIQERRVVGIQLAEVRVLLDGACSSPREVIDLQLTRLHEHIARQNRLAERMEELAMHIDRVETTSIDDLCHIIQAMTTMEKYFTAEQLDVLRERREGITEQHMHEVRDSWNEIIPKVRNAMAANVDLTSPEILAIAKRWKALVDEFTGGDAQIAKAVLSMSKHGGQRVLRQNGAVPTPEMVAYEGTALRWWEGWGGQD